MKEKWIKVVRKGGDIVKKKLKGAESRNWRSGNEKKIKEY